MAFHLGDAPEWHLDGWHSAWETHRSDVSMDGIPLGRRTGVASLLDGWHSDLIMAECGHSLKIFRNSLNKIKPLRVPLNPSFIHGITDKRFYTFYLLRSMSKRSHLPSR